MLRDSQVTTDISCGTCGQVLQSLQILLRNTKWTKISTYFFFNTL